MGRVETLGKHQSESCKTFAEEKSPAQGNEEKNNLVK